jgi:DNA-binding SARP family transcriptional activator
MGRLSLRLLSAPEARHADAPVSFATRKALALLAYLAVQGGTHTREKLTALLWPESDPERGRATLRYTLAALRTALGESREPGHLQIGRDAVRFEVASNVDVDLLAFEEESRVAQSLARETQGSTGARQRAVGILTNAAQRWRGEFLEGFSLPDAPAFDEWASVQREREHRQAELVFEQLAQAQSEAGARAEATETGARWVAMSPLNEAAHRQLMQLYLAAGEPAAALRAYTACQAVLKRELGTRPDPQTEALAERVRAARPASRQPVRDDRATGMLDWPLVGRSDEFVRLVELYHAALRGRSHLAVVRGEAGIGKTRLTRSFLAGPKAVVRTCCAAALLRRADASRISR